MASTTRAFGKPAPLRAMMQRGMEFFDEANNIDADTILTRAKRIDKIAATIGQIAGENLQLEGEWAAKRLLYTTSLGLGDIAARAVLETSPDEAENLLTSEQTHDTLLFVSGKFTSYTFDDLAKSYKERGAGYILRENGLHLKENPDVELEIGKGCPYALGNPRFEAIFNDCSDTIVRTYTQAYRQNMPTNLRQQIFRQKSR